MPSVGQWGAYPSLCSLALANVSHAQQMLHSTPGVHPLHTCNPGWQCCHHQDLCSSAQCQHGPHLPASMPHTLVCNKGFEASCQTSKLSADTCGWHQGPGLLTAGGGDGGPGHARGGQQARHLRHHPGLHSSPGCGAGSGAPAGHPGRHAAGCRPCSAPHRRPAPGWCARLPLQDTV